MTRADAAKLVAIIVTAYPNFDKFKDAQAVASTVDLWAAMFADDDARIVGLAVKKHIATNKWPPSVAELREIMLEIQRPELIAPDQAWAAVSDYMHTEREYPDKYLEYVLPPLVARAVEIIGYQDLYEMSRGSYGGSKPGMARVAFMQQYTAMYDREKARAMTPAEITKKIDSIVSTLPDKGQHLLEVREQARRAYDRCWDEITGRESDGITMTARSALER